MNKTININLGGVFFHIDELAYKKLKTYLDTIRMSLSDDPLGRDEILNDIETRIGELLSEKIKDVRQVVNENDIDEIINIMGKPEDYTIDEDLFYDTDNGSKKRSKKLYRDGDDKFLGGVASGMAHYLNIDVIWVRIAWLIMIFGFGFGVLAYIIFWILLPEAKTTAEKLEMMGEPVNISNIEKKIKEELTSASEKIKTGVTDVSEKIKNADYQKYGNRARSGFQELLDVIGKIIAVFFKIIGKFVGVLLIIISLTTIIGLLISLFAVGSVGFLNENWFYENGMYFHHITTLPIWVESIILFFLVAIPFFFLFILGMKILSPTAKLLGRTAKLSLFGIWLVALLFTIFVATKTFMYRAFNGSVIETTELVSNAADTLKVRMTDNRNLSGNIDLRRKWGSEQTVIVQGTPMLYSNNVRVNIVVSDTDTPYVKIKKRSKGKSNFDARDNAADIQYRFDLTDAVLSLDGYFLSDEQNRLLDQDVYVDVYIPVGQVIYLDRSTSSFLDYVKMADNSYVVPFQKHYFKMTEDGLTCLDCPEDVQQDDENNTGKPQSFQMNIDKKGVKLEVVNKQKEKALVKIDENGVHIETVTDTLKK